MSILGGGGGGSMEVPPMLRQLKKQASFFLKEKIKTARLALTDVTPAQLMAEEATNGDQVGPLPDAVTLKMISKAAFEVDDYWRIVEVLHKRLLRFDRGNWIASYKALVVVEHLLMHGPERIADEFQCDRDVVKEMESFEHVDERGFNWGLSVRKKSERILKMLEKGPLLKEERDKARKISRGIQGFSSFCLRASSQEPSLSLDRPFNRSISDTPQDMSKKMGGMSLLPCNPKMEDLTMANVQAEDIISRENLAPNHEDVIMEGSWESAEESKSLLGEHKETNPRKNTWIQDRHCPPSDEASTPLVSTVD